MRLANPRPAIDGPKATGKLRFTEDPGDRGTLVIRCSIISAFLLGLLLIQERECHAQQAPGVVVDYDAPKECPSAATFRQALANRLPTNRTVELGLVNGQPPGVLGLFVRVRQSKGAYQAELTTVTGEGRSTPRLLNAPICAELMDAMAFTAALTVDPNASFEDKKSAPTTSGASSSTAATPPLTSATTPSPTPPAGVDDVRESEQAQFEPPPTHASHQALWVMSVLAGASLTSPIEPGMSPALLGGLRYADESSGAWSPAVTVAAFGSVVVNSTRAEEATFSAWGAQVEFCPSMLRMSPLTARPCLSGQLMSLHAKGEGLANPNEVSVAVPNVSVHVEVQHALTPRWFLTGLLGTQLLFERHRFEIGRPGREIASTRLVAPFISLRIGAFLDPAY